MWVKCAGVGTVCEVRYVYESIIWVLCVAIACVR